MEDLEPTVLAIAKTKLNSYFPNAQFRVEEYYFSKEYRKCCTYNWEGGPSLS